MRGRGGGRGRGTGGRGRGRGGGGYGPDEPGMKKLSDPDVATVSIPSFIPQRTPGPHLPTSQLDCAFDYFLLLFDNNIIDEICVNSNSYAELHRDKYPYSYSHYPDGGLTRLSFYQFLAVVIYMGLHPRDDYFSYWSTDPLFISQYIQSVPISRNTFSAILTFLHVSSVDPLDVDTSDRLHKVRCLMSKLKSNCQQYYHPYKHVAVDERMVKSKGRFTCKQYVRMKPVKWGFKLWVLSDSYNGYTWNFEVYRGKEGETISSNGLGYDVVIKMVSGLENQGYIVYTDNFYSSSALFLELQRQKFGAVGTIATNRRGCPDALEGQKKKMLKSTCERGTGVWIRDQSITYGRTLKWYVQHQQFMVAIQTIR